MCRAACVKDVIATTWFYCVSFCFCFSRSICFSNIQWNIILSDKSLLEFLWKKLLFRVEEKDETWRPDCMWCYHTLGCLSRYFSGSLVLLGKRNDGTSDVNNVIPHTHTAYSASEIIILWRFFPLFYPNSRFSLIQCKWWNKLFRFAFPKFEWTAAFHRFTNKRWNVSPRDWTLNYLSLRCLFLLFLKQFLSFHSFIHSFVHSFIHSFIHSFSK